MNRGVKVDAQRNRVLFAVCFFLFEDHDALCPGPQIKQSFFPERWEHTTLSELKLVPSYPVPNV